MRANRAMQAVGVRQAPARQVTGRRENPRSTRGKCKELIMDAATTTAERIDFVRTGPEALGGRYLRRFWQPIYLSRDSQGTSRPHPRHERGVHEVAVEQARDGQDASWRRRVPSP